jgi:hypothetical protein
VAGFGSCRRPWPGWRRLSDRSVGCCRNAFSSATGSESGIGGDSMRLTRVLWVDRRCERDRVEHRLQWRAVRRQSRVVLAVVASAAVAARQLSQSPANGQPPVLRLPSRLRGLWRRLSRQLSRPLSRLGWLVPDWRLGWCVGMRQEFARGAAALEQDCGGCRGQDGRGMAGLCDRRQGRVHGSEREDEQ